LIIKSRTGPRTVFFKGYDGRAVRSKKSKHDCEKLKNCVPLSQRLVLKLAASIIAAN